jgi:hypothetical protein
MSSTKEKQAEKVPHIRKKGKVREPSAYNNFCATQRPILEEQHPTASLEEIGNMLQETWKGFSSEEKSKYTDTITTTSSSTSSIGKNAYHNYYRQESEKMGQDNPEISKQQRRIMINEKWKNMSDAEKSQFKVDGGSMETESDSEHTTPKKKLDESTLP